MSTNEAIPKPNPYKAIKKGISVNIKKYSSSNIKSE